MSTINDPHDKVFKNTFRCTNVASGYFRHNLPSDVLKNIDLAGLRLVPGSYVDRKLHSSASDILYSVDYAVNADGYDKDNKDKLKKVKLLLYLLFEHKSSADPMTTFQMLRYMVRIWERYCTEHKNTTSLPPIYPMVIYHGKRSWHYPLDFHSLLAVKNPSLLNHIPNFSPVLQDLSQLDDNEIRGEVPSRIVLLVLKYIFREDLKERLPEILSLGCQMLKNENEREIIFTLLYYLTEGTGKLNEKTLETVLKKSAHGGDIMQSFLNKYFEQGVTQGVTQGVAQGVAQGELRLLSRLLRKRFGDLPGWVEKRLQKASARMLEVWSDRILTASSLDEVFAE